jgi:predicted transcriptional regulator
MKNGKWIESKAGEPPVVDVNELSKRSQELAKQARDSAREVESRKTTSVWFDREDLASRTYKGKTPPCINKILNGSPEGLRNEYGIRLASYFLNFRRFQPQAVQKIMKDWNRMNTTNLDTAELDSLIKSAAQGKYVYGCSDPTLSQSCVKEECPITKRTIVLTEAQKEHAEKMLAQNNLLDIVVSYGHKRLIGEDNTLIINFIEICSGQTLYPISGIISGYSGSGKNESIRAIKPLIPGEWLFEFTTSTPEAIKYIPEDFAGTLIIYEASGMQSKTGSLGLRAVGEGESIETIYPMRDEETGKMTLGRAKTNAKNFITTESAIDIEPDLYRRVLKKSMNPSYVLTKRVCAKVLRESHLPDSLRDLLHKDQKPIISPEDFQNALRVQDWKAEVVLFAPEDLLGLIDVAVTVEQQVALRTQFNKILSFIKVLALLNQKRRVNVKLGDKTYVVAGPEDYKLGLTILGDTILETVSRIEKRQRDVMELFDRISPLDKNKVAQQLKVSTVTAAKALKTLARSGYLQENTTAKTYTYEVMRDKPSSIVILQDTSKYSLFYEKELKSFLDHILSLISSGVLEKSRVKIENVPEKWDTSDKTSDKMPSEPIPEVSEQKEAKHLVFGELTSKNKPDKEGEKEG